MKYRKKPVVIEAIQWNCQNVLEMAEFVGLYRLKQNDTSLLIETLEGVMEARPYDWIIRGVKGECYPCKPDIFEQTYEKVED